jgi:hypothetical protein
VLPYDVTDCIGLERHVPAALMREGPDLAAALDAISRGDHDVLLADEVHQEALDNPDAMLDEEGR